MSSHLVWQITKKHNAFLNKQRRGRGGERIQFSAEQQNLTARSSFRWSGFANPEPIGMEVDERKIQLTKGALKKTTQEMRTTHSTGKNFTVARKDLAAVIRRRRSRLARAAVRKSRKSWAKVQGE
eukprot:TRINITY_DN443_c0_g2_i1.p3 TRINITY_DN443_c0_g2~~TRINITY_DN443_c0_g2_i1.p3  ORF type:complete len:125 (+),score=54.10 TRINITY_DN443_c0_g2_i1:86-460(+)